MNFIQYQPLAIRTLKDLGSTKANLAHMGLGLSTELMEYNAAIHIGDKENAGEELGDAAWFTVSTFHLLKIKFNVRTESLFNPNDSGLNAELNDQVYKVVNLIKKHFAYDVKILDKKGRIFDYMMSLWMDFTKAKYIDKEFLSRQLHKLWSILEVNALSHNLNFGMILNDNIRKLAARYPGPYTDFHASTRLDKYDKESKSEDS